MKLTPKEALLELQKRKRGFRIEDHLFDKQLAFVLDPANYKLGLCSRRAGKSTACSVDMVMTANNTPNCTVLYVTGARTDAKTIIWSEIKRFNDQYSLNGQANESELRMSFPNGSVIRLAGAKDEASVDKLRGQLPPVKKTYIDEAQNIKDSLLKRLINDVIEPSLIDYNGSLIMIGTPPPVPTGYFIEASKSNQWSVHKWTFFNNPFIPLKSGLSHQASLQRVLKRRGVSVSDPSIRREFFGELATDTDSLVFQYNPAINDYNVLPPGKYAYILGVDLGFNDADALAVLAWNDQSRETFLVEEIVVRQQGITELVEQIEGLRKKYDIFKIVMDMGGLGKKIGEELLRRYKINVEPAEKVRKFEYIELLNDALRTGALKAKQDSAFAQDCYKVEWNLDKATPDRKVVSDGYHSDICDAVLYAWRCSFSFTYTKPEPKPEYATPAYWQEVANKMEQDAEDHFSALEQAEKIWD